MMLRLLKALGITVLAIVVIFAALVLWPAASAPLPVTHPVLAISNVRVVDVESGQASEPRTVVVRGARIAAITDAPPPGSFRLDGRGGYLIPGLWDMHSHSWQVSPQMHFPLQLANGVTAVRDMMDCPEATDPLIACVADKRRWSRAATAGQMAAPRFVGVASFYYEKPTLSASEIQARVRADHRRGVDYLKAYNRLSRPAYLQLLAEGRAVGLPVVGHLPEAVTLEEAIDGGQQSFEHAHLFLRGCFARSDERRAGRLQGWSQTRLVAAMAAEQDPRRCAMVFTRMRARGAWFVPTHVTREEDARATDPAFLNDPRLRYADPLSRWAWRDDAGGTATAHPGREGAAALDAYFRRGLALTGAAHAAGVRVLVGTDTVIGGFRYHDELGHLVRAGLTPAQALRAATLSAAEYAGRTRDFGTIAPGKVADLVVLGRNPLTDIGATRDIRAVVFGGRLYDRAGSDALLAFTRRQANHPANWAKLIWGFATSPTSSEL